VPITDLLDTAHSNAHLFLSEHPELAALIDDVHAVFVDVRELPALATEPALAFLGVSEGAFLSAAQQAASGQLPPSFLASRGALEAALIGWYVQLRPQLLAVWNARTEGEEAARLVREAFRIDDLREALREANAAVARQFGIAYDKTLNYGAELPSGIAIEVRHAVYVATFSALMSLFVFLVAFPQVFTAAALPERLVALADRLTECFPAAER
jgi:hypothetical protein